MADDRPAETEVEAIARIDREFADFRSTMLVRAGRSDTGTIEPTLRKATDLKADTLLCDGSLISRVTYAVLWQWANDRGLVGVWFTTGDGVSTFGLPNFQGRYPVGVGALAGDTYALGQMSGTAKPTIATANLPVHKHNVSIANHDQHNHGFLTDQDGAHGGHFPGGPAFLTPSGSSYGLAAWNAAGTGVGTHNHGGTTAFGPVSAHAVTESNVGSGTAFDVRAPYFALNWVIYT